MSSKQVSTKLRGGNQDGSPNGTRVAPVPANGGNSKQVSPVVTSGRGVRASPAKLSDNVGHTVGRQTQKCVATTPVTSPKGAKLQLPQKQFVPAAALWDAAKKTPVAKPGAPNNKGKVVIGKATCEIACQTDDISELTQLSCRKYDRRIIPFKSLASKKKRITASTQTPKLRGHTELTKIIDEVYFLRGWQNLLHTMREVLNIGKESARAQKYEPVVYKVPIFKRIDRLRYCHLHYDRTVTRGPLSIVADLQKCNNYICKTEMTRCGDTYDVDHEWIKFDAGVIPLKFELLNDESYLRIKTAYNQAGFVGNEVCIPIKQSEPNPVFTFGLTPVGTVIREDVNPEAIIATAPIEYIPPENRPFIIRKACWYNRLLFNKEPSKIYLDTLDQRKVGRLTVKKDNDGIGETVPSTLINEKLRIYLLMQKWPEYKNRAAAVDHITKLARKYYPDELKIQFSSLTPDQVTSHYVTVQKVVDEKFVPFLLASESPEADRRQRIVRLKQRLHLRSGGMLFRHNENFQ